MTFFKFLFAKPAYKYAYVILFATGLCLGLPSIVGSLGLFTLIAAITTLVTICCLIIIARDNISKQNFDFFSVISQLSIPLVAIGIFLGGFLTAEIAVFIYIVPQLKLALALKRAGYEPWSKSIEIISIEPEIAGYVLGSTPRFYEAGETHYFLLDTNPIRKLMVN
jgi:uncharacterized integral membrane protein